MRRWRSSTDEQGCYETCQIVLTTSYRLTVLKLAHKNVLAGDLGPLKIYFFGRVWKPLLQSFAVNVRFYQKSGKPNQKVPPAPLCPISVVGEPFKHIIVATKSGHKYVLTIMCAATRIPEAVPIRTLKAQMVVKELVKFFTTFGLPWVVQTDKGTNFTSKTFAQVLHELGIKHQTSSAYHPESQSCLERFHKTLKSMIRAIQS